MPMSVFKAYDVRGVYGEDLTDDIAYRTARAFAAQFSPKKVAIGHDMRPSSKPLVDAAIRGFIDSGAHVLDIGMCTSPMLGFTVASMQLDGGIMVTASHNPKQYNGLKLLAKKALQVHSGSGMKEIEKLALAGGWTDGPKGSVEKMDIMLSYLKHVKAFAKDIKGIKIVVDAGNGMGGFTAQPMFSQLDIELVPMYFEPDGNFPNHEANPIKPETLAELQHRVVAQGADLGIAFDGDADRARVIDEKGNAISSDLLFAALMTHELPGQQDRKVYYDLRFSKAVPEAVKAAGGEPVIMRVGNPFYKEKLQSEGGYCAAELSGHIMYRDNYCVDDGLFAVVMALSMRCQTGKAMSELIAPFTTHVQSEELNFTVKDTAAALAALQHAFTDAAASFLDGVTLEGDGWWFNARASNTEPLLRVRAEADNQQLLDKTIATVRKTLEE
ncbi:hypothetical protein AUJ68_03065 [Candidatus Woesearchaeota archaeon CG1_02_57_44]|nr:MAG: hypothetical protein AUJ68_03065 [Candidatus Woesearchaeota archaeon CG1_02_57_44]